MPLKATNILTPEIMSTMARIRPSVVTGYTSPYRAGIFGTGEQARGRKEPIALL
jgi:hypothetical protein